MLWGGPPLALQSYGFRVGTPFKLEHCTLTETDLLRMTGAHPV
jgi:hypothetical protein